MGIKDQFQEKAKQLDAQPRERAGRPQDDVNERGQQRERQPQGPQRGRQTPEGPERVQRDARERFDQDFDA
ncbi:hypothetical protein [Streptomyces fructofermentans]|uniref:Uncharacterized protein n=1 Tax=Streptomyces fructofermentans TaxID=152141 RepID=A0A918K2Y5_9ACTN|nr:hypothetical protein [Streptomyces fructofermentans]GGX45626.1 hypothetical protein GCM10010515_10490 [Streptomyces fructofermentans]